MGMGGGGSQTVTQNNVPWNAEAIKFGQDEARRLYETNPVTYPSFPTYAQPSPFQWDAYNAQGTTGMQTGNTAAGYTQPLIGSAMGANTSLASGGGFAGAQPWFNNLSGVSGSNPGQVYANALMYTGGAGPTELSKTASGGYQGSNPYLDAQIEAAQRGTTNQYQTTLAPGLASDAARSGRFYSGGLANQNSIAQQNLATALGDTENKFRGAAYEAERGRQVQAARDEWALRNQAFGAAGGIANQGAQIQAGAAASGLDAYNRLLTGQQAAINAAPALAGIAGTGYNQAAQAGTAIQQLMQAQIQSDIERHAGVQQSPWSNLNQYASITGSPIPGMSTSTQPVSGGGVGGQIAQGVGTALSAATLGKMLFPLTFAAL